MSTFISGTVSPQRGVRDQVTKLVAPYLQFAPLAKVSGSAAPDNTIQQTPWIQVQPGSVLELKLNVMALVGTLDIQLETMADPADASENPRLLTSQFDSVNASVVPFKSVITAPCDTYIRLTATPGTAATQTANWEVTGKAYFAGTRNPV